MINGTFIKRMIIFILVLITALTSTSTASTTIDMDKPCIVIHAGEYPGKDGKRSYIADEIPNLNSKKYPTENNGTELGEYYLNEEICKKVADYIRAEDPNIVVIEFYSKDSSTDLNKAGIKAITYNPDLYLSIHHNCTNDKHGKARGYVCITAEGKYSKESEDIAQHFSDNLKDVESKSGLPRWSGRSDGTWDNTTYIGELNRATDYCPSVLIEVGFFNNLEDLKVVTNDKKTDIIAKSIAKTVVDDFHDGVYDNDQPSETSQDSTIIVKPEIKNNEDKEEGIKDPIQSKESKLDKLKLKMRSKKSSTNNLKSRIRSGPRTTTGIDKITEIKKD